MWTKLTCFISQFYSIGPGYRVCVLTLRCWIVFLSTLWTVCMFVSVLGLMGTCVEIWVVWVGVQVTVWTRTCQGIWICEPKLYKFVSCCIWWRLCEHGLQANLVFARLACVWCDRFLCYANAFAVWKIIMVLMYVDIGRGGERARVNSGGGAY